MHEELCYSHICRPVNVLAVHHPDRPESMQVTRVYELMGLKQVCFAPPPQMTPKPFNLTIFGRKWRF